MTSIRRTRSGRVWEARCRDPDGKQRSKTFTTKREAERFLERLGTDLQRGDWLDPQRQKIGFAQWTAEGRNTIVHLEPNTIAFYISMLRHIRSKNLVDLYIEHQDHQRSARGLEPVRHQTAERAAFIQREMHLFGAQRGTALTDDALRAVAAVYRQAWQDEDSVTKAVAEAFNVSPSTAAKRVMAARDRGFLGPTPSNRGWEELGSK